MMTDESFQRVLGAVRDNNSTSWAIADALLEALARVPRVTDFERLHDRLADAGFDYAVSSLKAYHQTAMTFAPGSRRRATFSAHETARSMPRALDEAIEVYGEWPTVDQVRAVKANLNAGLAPDFRLPDLDALERDAAEARAAYDRAVREGSDPGDLFARASEAEAMLRDARRAHEVEAEKQVQRDVKKVREAYWLARALAKRVSGRDRAALAGFFAELDALYGDDGEEVAA